MNQLSLLPIRRCTPDECDCCEPWGPNVPGKTKCKADPASWEGREFKFSTTLGGACVLGNLEEAS